MATVIVKGMQAIELAEQRGLRLSKYADPTEDAREGLSVSQAREVAAEDPSLIWVEVPSRFEQATEGLQISKAGGVVRVQDSETTWLCRAREWHAAEAQLSAQAPIADDPEGMSGEQAAYAALCRAVSSPIISIGGTDRGPEAEKVKLARWAQKAGLLPEALAPMVDASAALKREIEELRAKAIRVGDLTQAGQLAEARYQVELGDLGRAKSYVARARKLLGEV